MESTTFMMSGQQVEEILFHPSNTSLRNGPGDEKSGAAFMAYPARKYKSAQGQCRLILPTYVSVKMISFSLLIVYFITYLLISSKETKRIYNRTSWLKQLSNPKVT